MSRTKKYDSGMAAAIPACAPGVLAPVSTPAGERTISVMATTRKGKGMCDAGRLRPFPPSNGGAKEAAMGSDEVKYVPSPKASLRAKRTSNPLLRMEWKFSTGDPGFFF